MEERNNRRSGRRDFRDQREERRELAEDMIEGRNALTEALKSGRTIDKVFVAAGDTDKALARLSAMAKDAGAVVVATDRRKLDQMSPTGAHQGIMAQVAAHEYATVEQILQNAADKGEAPLLILCDELSDPHNLGAIMRTAECAGAHGVIIPKRRSVGLTAVVSKTSAGAVEYMPVARVSNMAATIRDLKKAGVWVFGTAADAHTDLYHADLKGPAAIVIGNPDRTHQVLISLLDNAFKYTPEGGTVTLSARPCGDVVRVTVRDTGIGIGAEDLPHVFDRFYKADKSHHGRGTGLGLAIAYEIMKNLGEEMAVESTPGEGSAFSFTLHIAND